MGDNKELLYIHPPKKYKKVVCKRYINEEELY